MYMWLYALEKCLAGLVEPCSICCIAAWQFTNMLFVLTYTVCTYLALVTLSVDTNEESFCSDLVLKFYSCHFIHAVELLFVLFLLDTCIQESMVVMTP